MIHEIPLKPHRKHIASRVRRPIGLCGLGKVRVSYRGTLLVAQLVETLRYKSEGRGFDSRWCHRNFSFT